MNTQVTVQVPANIFWVFYVLVKLGCAIYLQRCLSDVVGRNYPIKRLLSHFIISFLIQPEITLIRGILWSLSLIVTWDRTTWTWMLPNLVAVSREMRRGRESYEKRVASYRQGTKDESTPNIG